MSNIEPISIQNYSFGTYKVYIAENFIAQSLTSVGLSPLFSWNEGTSKIEFILQINDTNIPVEVKSGNVTRAKSLKVYKDKYMPKLSVILSGKTIKYVEEKRLLYCPLYLADRLLELVAPLMK